MKEQNEFTREDLEKVAMLSRLSLTEAEKDKFLLEMKEILEYISQVTDMTAENVESSGGKNYGKQFIDTPNKNTVREDIVLNEGGLYTEALLNDAPKRFEDYVEVSQVLDKHKNKN